MSQPNDATYMWSCAYKTRQSWYRTLCKIRQAALTDEILDKPDVWNLSCIPMSVRFLTLHRCRCREKKICACFCCVSYHCGYIIGSYWIYVDNSWWRHQMQNIFRGHRSPVKSPHKGQWYGALIFFLICAWINVWVNNREAETPSCPLWRHCNATHASYFGSIDAGTALWLPQSK